MLLNLEQVRKTYGKFTLDCSIKLQPGTVTGLIGQNGAGKSTTFKAILNLIRPESGTVEVFDTPADKITQQQRAELGVVMADAGFSGYLKIKDVMAVMAKMYRQFDQKAFLAQCEQFQLPMDKKIKDFSTGMKAKLKVLLAMSHEAKILILDEPTAGLDVIAREEILDLLRGYMEQEADKIGRAHV